MPHLSRGEAQAKRGTAMNGCMRRRWWWAAVGLLGLCQTGDARSAEGSATIEEVRSGTREVRRRVQGLWLTGQLTVSISRSANPAVDEEEITARRVAALSRARGQGAPLSMEAVHSNAASKAAMERHGYRMTSHFEMQAIGLKDGQPFIDTAVIEDPPSTLPANESKRYRRWTESQGMFWVEKVGLSITGSPINTLHHMRRVAERPAGGLNNEWQYWYDILAPEFPAGTAHIVTLSEGREIPDQDSGENVDATTLYLDPSVDHLIRGWRTAVGRGQVTTVAFSDSATVGGHKLWTKRVWTSNKFVEGQSISLCMTSKIANVRVRTEPEYSTDACRLVDVSVRGACAGEEIEIHRAEWERLGEAQRAQVIAAMGAQTPLPGFVVRAGVAEAKKLAIDSQGLPVRERPAAQPVQAWLWWGRAVAVLSVVCGAWILVRRMGTSKS